VRRQFLCHLAGAQNLPRMADFTKDGGAYNLGAIGTVVALNDRTAVQRHTHSDVDPTAPVFGVYLALNSQGCRNSIIYLGKNGTKAVTGK